MGTKLVESTVRGTNPDRLTDQQLVFVHELAADTNFNATSAAKAAGYRHPTQAAGKLVKQPKIAAALGRVLYDRLERCRLTQDEVVQYLSNVLFFNPLHHFRPGESGTWLIDDLSTIPEEVGMLIDNLEVERSTDKHGTVTDTFKVKLVSKATALGLAMRHVGVERHEVKHSIDWDQLATQEHAEFDVIEAKIEEAGK